MEYFIFFILPLIFFGVPWFWKSWKSLMTWHVIVSVLINGVLAEIEVGMATGIGGGSAGAAGAGYAVIFALFSLFLHLFSSGAKGILIFRDNVRSLKLFPVYAIVGIIAYILVVVVIYFMCRIGASLILDLDFSTLQKN